MELAAGRIEGALLVLGCAATDERPPFVIKGLANNAVHRLLSQARGLMELLDEPATEHPQMVAVQSLRLARQTCAQQMSQERLEAFHDLLARRHIAIFKSPAAWPLRKIGAIIGKIASHRHFFRLQRGLRLRQSFGA